VVILCAGDSLTDSDYPRHLERLLARDVITGLRMGIRPELKVVRVIENLNEGTDTVQSSVTYTLGANVENLTLTGSAAINGTGNDLNNVLTGNSAANVLTGGAGNDTYVVDNLGDVVSENLNEGMSADIDRIIEAMRVCELRVQEQTASDEVAVRLARYGPNELHAARRVSPLALFAAQFKNVLIVILLVAVGLSVVLGHSLEAAAIAVIVLFAVVLGFAQEFRAERALDAGCDGYLAKPIDTRALPHQVRLFLH